VVSAHNGHTQVATETLESKVKPPHPLVRIGDRNCPKKLLCLHGGTGFDHSYFLPYLEPLARHAELVFYRQGDGGALTIEGLVKELDLVVTSLDASDITLLGHSFGGALALEYVNRLERINIRALILVTWVYNKEWFSEEHATFIGQLTKNASEALSPTERLKELVAGLAPLYFTPPFRAKGGEILATIEYNATLFDAIFNGYLSDFDLLNVVGALQTRTLSIAGADDRMVGASYIDQAVQGHRRITSKVMKGVAHFPFIEKPNEFNSLILDFLG
jgi:pimeloyl-ACP methyl ester carboxylesterase